MLLARYLGIRFALIAMSASLLLGCGGESNNQSSESNVASNSVNDAESGDSGQLASENNAASNESESEPAAPKDPLIQVHQNQRIALVGNSLAERMNLFGHFETMLHSRFPDKEIKFRNFGWPADEVSIQQRPNNYTALDDPLEIYGPDMFFCFFGFNESFAGIDDVPYYKQRYVLYLNSLRERFSKEGASPTIVLVSPIAFESTGDPLHPLGVTENANLQAYAQATMEVAQEQDLPYVDLFDFTQTLFSEEQGAQYTINGAHLNEAGDLQVAKAFDQTLFGTPTMADVASDSYEQLRAAVNDKSWIHLNDYRMLNGWYVYGGRRTFDTETFPLEYKKIRKMAAVRDRYVWDIAQGKEVTEVPDDSETGELIIPPTGVGRHFPRAEPKELKYLSAEECIETMQVPEGFEVQAFASEAEFPVLANPCQLNFDSQGRLWVACMPNYPQWRPGDPRPDDRLLILEDTDKDGKADECKVFYDKLICPTGFEFWNGGVLVVDEPRILFLKDTDGDDKADEVVHLIDGIATDDTHHTMGAWEYSHSGLLHMLEGVSLSTTVETPWGPIRNKNTAGSYVFDPRTLQMRRFQTPGYGNPWCFVFDKWGNGIVGDGTNAKQHWTSALSGADPRQRSTSRPIFDNEGMRPAVGNDFLMSRAFPDDVQGQFIYACVINMNGLPRFVVTDEDDGAGLTGHRIEDLLMSTDKTFRPVDPMIGPDGALWFGDWCNALIGHMQYSQRDPNRDQKHGRIYRMVHKGSDLIQPETQADASIPQLLEQLSAYEYRTRYRARRELHDRDQGEVLAATDSWISQLSPDTADFERLLCEALWIQENFHAIDLKLVERVMGAEDYRARAAAIHVVSNEVAHQVASGSHDSEILNSLVQLLNQSISDEHPRVRLETVRGASFLGTPEAGRLALQSLDMPVDYWIDYTLKHTLLALRPVWLQAHAKGEFLVDVSDTQRDYFEQFLTSLGPSVKAIPHLQVLADSGTSEEAREAAITELTKLEGKARNGEIVFQRVCSACHLVNGRGINFGPDLTKIKERIGDADLRVSILNSIIDPNLDIDEPYKTLQVITLDGKVFNGFLESETDESVVMRIEGGKLLEISVDDIDEQVSSAVSSMPEGLAYSVAPAELLDLVEFIRKLNE